MYHWKALKLLTPTLLLFSKSTFWNYYNFVTTNFILHLSHDWHLRKNLPFWRSFRILWLIASFSRKLVDCSSSFTNKFRYENLRTKTIPLWIDYFRLGYHPIGKLLNTTSWTKSVLRSINRQLKCALLVILSFDESLSEH